MNDIFYWLEGLDDLSYNKVKDYITNLQQEIENKNNEIDVLKDQVEWWKQQCDDLEMQIGESNG